MVSYKTMMMVFLGWRSDQAPAAHFPSFKSLRSSPLPEIEFRRGGKFLHGLKQRD